MREDIIMYFEKFYEIKGVDTSDSQAYFDTILSRGGYQIMVFRNTQACRASLL
jgi:hypothetical protein